MERMDQKMKKVLSLVVCMVALSSCATLKKQFCDCCREKAAAEEKAGSVPPAPHSEHSERGAKADKSDKADPLPIVVDNSDIELTNRMLKAVDNYVFKGDAKEFTDLCTDTRFDCVVNSKRFPASRKKIKRKVPPFVSGSKSGLQGNERVNVKYSFYP